MRISATGTVIFPCSLCGENTTPEHRCSGCGSLICQSCDVNHNLPMAHVSIDHRAHAAETTVIGH